MTVKEFTTFKDFKTAVRIENITCIFPNEYNPDKTDIYFIGSNDNHITVNEGYEEVMKEINS